MTKNLNKKYKETREKHQSGTGQSKRFIIWGVIAVITFFTVRYLTENYFINDENSPEKEEANLKKETKEVINSFQKASQDTSLKFYNENFKVKILQGFYYVKWPQEGVPLIVTSEDGEATLTVKKLLMSEVGADFGVEKFFKGLPITSMKVEGDVLREVFSKQHYVENTMYSFKKGKNEFSGVIFIIKRNKKYFIVQGFAPKEKWVDKKESIFIMVKSFQALGSVSKV